MPHRLFIAVPVAPDLRNRITRWEADHKDLPVQWLDSKDLHITIVPPWQDEKPEEIIKRLETFASPSFMKPATIDMVSAGPTRFNPRLIWGLGHTTPDLLKLRTEVEHVLSFEPDKRPFKLHLTLARFAPTFNVPFGIRKLNEHVTWTQPLDRLALYETLLTPEGVTYRILTEVSCSHLPSI
ncbi:MAG: RNA 2',3'-cyclic phosphodiesterase [Patescibacteria group bacterium]